MSDILHDFPINRPAADVYRGVVAPAGLDQWWTKRSRGSPVVGSEYELWFGPDFDWRAEVTAALPDRVIEWRITRALPDWVGTTIRFDLEPTDAGTQVRFAHRGWPGPIEHYRISSYCWAMYLRILTRHLEHGESVPYELRLSA